MRRGRPNRISEAIWPTIDYFDRNLKYLRVITVMLADEY
jgi:hypothetical protein